MKKALAIGLVNLKRMLRDRSNIFFVFIFPLAIILLVGLQFGGGGPGTVIAVNPGDDPLAAAIVDAIRSDTVEVEKYETGDDVSRAVSDDEVTAGLVFPDDLQGSVAGTEVPEIQFVSSSANSLLPLVAAAISETTSAFRVEQSVARSLDLPLVEVAGLGSAAPSSDIAVRTEEIGDQLFPSGTGQFSVGASQQLVLFVFLTTLTGSAAIIQSRQLGVSARMLSTATSPTVVVVGEALGRFAVGLFQGLYIMGVSLVVFDVDWGDPLGAGLMLIALAAAGAGAAMLLGTLFRNDQQAAGFSVMIGLGMAAIGGCMLPLELFPPAMRTAARFTPQGWANFGFSDLVYRGGDLVSVLDEAGVLFTIAAVLLIVSGWRLRRAIANPV